AISIGKARSPSSKPSSVQIFFCGLCLKTLAFESCIGLDECFYILDRDFLVRFKEWEAIFNQLIVIHSHFGL
ncbi:MAG: hypothetical protein Q9174_003677, partial [Haloplaca sp. 1 TL-2023]